MRPSLSGRSHSLYSAAPAFFVEMPASPPVLSIFLVSICRQLSARSCRCIRAALLLLLRRRPRVQIRPFCPRRRPNRSSRVQIMGFCPRRRPLVLSRTAARARLSQSPYPPFQGGTSGPTGFPSPQWLSLPATPARHLMMPC